MLGKSLNDLTWVVHVGLLAVLGIHLLGLHLGRRHLLVLGLLRLLVCRWGHSTVATARRHVRVAAGWGHVRLYTHVRVVCRGHRHVCWRIHDLNWGHDVFSRAVAKQLGLRVLSRCVCNVSLLSQDHKFKDNLAGFRVLEINISGNLHDSN